MLEDDSLVDELVSLEVVVSEEVTLVSLDEVGSLVSTLVSVDSPLEEDSLLGSEDVSVL